MKLMKTVLVGLSLTGLVAAAAVQATPEEDRAAFQKFFTDKFKNSIRDKNPENFIHGALALSEDAFSQWQEIDGDFPPYGDAMDHGRELWEKPFANGKSFKDCFKEDLNMIRASFPRYDEEKDTILTLEGEINACREANGEKPFAWKKGDIAAVSAYISHEGRGQKIDVKIPNEKAEAWYEKGKAFFYTKRGQLNMACADCHIAYSGNYIRAELLSPAYGQISHFPTFRAKWDELGTLHRRYGGCNEQVRAKPFAPQSDEYKALEYFHTYMSNGLEWNGPAFRK